MEVQNSSSLKGDLEHKEKHLCNAKFTSILQFCLPFENSSSSPQMSSYSLKQYEQELRAHMALVTRSEEPRAHMA